MSANVPTIIFKYMLCVAVLSDSSWTIIWIDIVVSDQVCVLYASSRKGQEEEELGCERVDIPDESEPALLARFSCESKQCWQLLVSVYERTFLHARKNHLYALVQIPVI
jgi:hypothetical protein